jgi:small subunit ribosomal protein S4
LGDVKLPRRTWKKPKRPLNFDLKMEELKTLGSFGLKTKRELWKARTELSRIRNQARSLLALRQEVREKKEPILMKSLSKNGLVAENATLDDVLNLEVNDLLSRRLQSFVMKKFNFKTPYQARQAVIHGHIMIGDKKVNIPSYVIKTDEENLVKLSPESKFNTLLTESQSNLGSPETENLEIPKQEQPETNAEAEPEVTKQEQPETNAEAEPEVTKQS